MVSPIGFAGTDFGQRRPDTGLVPGYKPENAILRNTPGDFAEKTDKQSRDEIIANLEIDAAIRYIRSRSPEMNNRALDQIAVLESLRGDLGNQGPINLTHVTNAISTAISVVQVQYVNQRVTETKDYDDQVKSSVREQMKAHQQLVDNDREAYKESLNLFNSDPGLKGDDVFAGLGTRVTETMGATNKARAELETVLADPESKAQEVFKAQVEVAETTVIESGARTGQGYYAAVKAPKDRPDIRNEGVLMAERSKQIAVSTMVQVMPIKAGFAGQLIAQLEKQGVEIPEDARWHPGKLNQFLSENKEQVAFALKELKVEERYQGLAEKYGLEAQSGIEKATAGMTPEERKAFEASPEGQRLARASTITAEDLQGAVLKGFEARLVELNELKMKLGNTDLSPDARQALRAEYDAKFADIYSGANGLKGKDKEAALKTIEVAEKINMVGKKGSFEEKAAEAAKGLSPEALAEVTKLKQVAEGTVTGAQEVETGKPVVDKTKTTTVAQANEVVKQEAAQDQPAIVAG
ncbi:MAG: hypothetical protein MRY32_10015 [Rickettsiales bacterium]|nr:hypothetical protein [Rickettsiales bacterium]